MFAEATETPTVLGIGEWVRRNPLRAAFVLVRKPKQGRRAKTASGKGARSKNSLQAARNAREPWLLVASTRLADWPAKRLVKVYRQRMQIETAFQKLEAHLHSEINALGYPETALFGFCLALVAFNLYAVVMAALRAAHPAANVDETVSEHYLAAEIANTTQGRNIAVEDADWARFATATREEMCTFLLDLASRVNLAQWRKSKRRPKKPSTPRTKYKGKTHISTAKVLASHRGVLKAAT